MNRRNLILSFLGMILLLEFGVLIWQLSDDGNSSVSLDPKGPGEKITEIAAEIRLRNDGTIQVRERLSFRSERDAIKKGLYRSLYLSYKDVEGKENRRSYALQSARFNGESLNAEAKEQSDFYLIELKQIDPPIEVGNHTFEIDYTIKNAIERFPSYDQLRYEVTGSWTLPVLRGSVVLYLPPYLQSKSLVVNGYTGKKDSQRKDFLTDSPKENVIRLWTTKPLLNGDNFHFEIKIPKGFIN